MLSMKRVHSLGLTLFGAALLSLPGLAQVQLGRQTFGTVRTRPLTGAIGGTASFFLRIGGVAFGSVATGEDGWLVSDLVYDPQRPDGERLRVALSKLGQTPVSVTCAIPDWQLVPIARLAATDDDACVTLFGGEEDLAEAVPASQKEALIEELVNGGRIVLYHEALRDEILGLRLLQADMLLLSEDCAHLFSTAQGNTILGKGESQPDVAANAKAYTEVKSWLEGNQEQFQSYVITDSPAQPVTFRAHEGLLVLSGEPFWDCWKWSPERAAKLAQLEEEFDELLVDLLLEEITEEEFDTRAAALRRQVDEPGDDDIVKMPEYSSALTKLIREKNGINPAVYRSLQTTVRYLALFRHAKERCKPAFERLLATLASVETQPLAPVRKKQVETPGLWKASSD